MRTYYVYLLLCVITCILHLNDIFFLVLLMNFSLLSAHKKNDSVIALEAMDPNVPGPATMTFKVPSGIKTLTPYVWW